MNTLSTVEAVKRTPSGAFAITFLGGVVAGTRDEELGALAERLASYGKDANPVELAVEKRGDKLFITTMNEILPPPELGGPFDVVVAEAKAELGAIEQRDPGDETDAPDITEGEMHFRNLIQAAAYIKKLEEGGAL